jgi:Zn-dependent metalloprotease
MVQSADANIRRMAVDAIAKSEAIRAVRYTVGAMPTMMAPFPAFDRPKQRLIFSMQNVPPYPFFLPGRLVLKEGDMEGGMPVQDEAVKEAYEFSGDTYDFYKEVLGRNSIDGRGMPLISSVHLGRNLSNAFWNGRQMLYGDGDGEIFGRFTQSLDVVGHELTHGVVQYTSNLEYQDESGALNESFADVMGAMVKQWRTGQTVDQASWLMGAELLMPEIQAKAIRTFKGEKAYQDDPVLGTDPQPKHMENKYTGEEDNGGVHINSGIPNHAFYIVAVELGGKSWERAGNIWYKSLLRLTRDSNFQEAAEMTYEVANTEYGIGSAEAKAVKSGWDAVGIAI